MRFQGFVHVRMPKVLHFSTYIFVVLGSVVLIACIGSRLRSILGLHESLHCKTSSYTTANVTTCTCMHQLNAVFYSHTVVIYSVHTLCFSCWFHPQHSSINCPLMYRRVYYSMLQVHCTHACICHVYFNRSTLAIVFS